MLLPIGGNNPPRRDADTQIRTCGSWTLKEIESLSQVVKVKSLKKMFSNKLYFFFKQYINSNNPEF